MFITIEDATGPANLVVWPKFFEKRRRILLGSSMMALQGKIQRRGEVEHLIARQLFDLTSDLSGLSDRDADLKMGRGDEFAHGGGPYPRDSSRPAPRPKEMFDPDLRLKTLKVKAWNFQSNSVFRMTGR